MSKLNVVRQIKQGKSSVDFEAQKEMGWNNRFHLGKLPAYNAYNDANYLGMKQLREQIRKLDKDVGRRTLTRMKTPEGQQMLESDSYNEELNVVQSMWDDLGVTDDYRSIFDGIARDLDDKLRKDYFDCEISSLVRLSDHFSKLGREVTSREKSLTLLHKFDEALSRSNDLTDKILNDMKQCIKNIRIQSINIVNHFNKIREVCSYEIIGGKFDLEKINKVYNFDRNYLIKMKFDLEFLKGSNLDNFFNISEGWDPFLTALAEKVEGKLSVEMNQDMLNAVKNSQFLIIQDIVFYQMASRSSRRNYESSKSPGKVKINYPLANSRIVSPALRPTSNSSFGYYNLNLNKNNKEYNSLFFTKEALGHANGNKNVQNKRIQIEMKEKDFRTENNIKTFQQNVSRQNFRESQNSNHRNEQIDSKNYNNIFNSNNLNDKNAKKEIIIEKLDTGRSQTAQGKRDSGNSNTLGKQLNNNAFKKEEVKYQDMEMEEDNYNFNEFNDSGPNRKEVNLKEELKNLSKIEERKQLEESIREESPETKKVNTRENVSVVNTEPKIVSNDFVVKDEDIQDEIDYEFNEMSLEKNDKSRNTNGKNLDDKTKTEEKPKLESIIEEKPKIEDKPKLESKIEEKSIIQSKVEEKPKIENKPRISVLVTNNNDDNNSPKFKNDNLPKSEIETKEHKKVAFNFINDIFSKPLSLVDKTSSNFQLQKELNLEKFVPKVHSTDKTIEKVNSQEDPQFTIGFLNDNISNFQSTYEEYYRSIPQEQIISFKPSNSVHSYTKGINPKFLLAKSNDELKGLCCVTYDSMSNNSLRLCITHISAKSTDHLESILTSFVSFIFTNFQCEELIIEIHYQFIEGAFVMNKGIFSILKDKLKFKWSNLENKTAQDRLQKMSLKRKDTSVIDPIYRQSLRLVNAMNVQLSLRTAPSQTLHMKNEKEINGFPLIYSLVQLTNSQFTLENELFKNFDWMKLKQLCKDFVLSSEGESDKLNYELTINEIMFNQIKTSSYNSQTILMNINTKFTDILTCELNSQKGKYLYNRIGLSMAESLIDRESGQVFYLISSADGNNSILIAQLNESFKRKIEGSQINLSEMFFEIYPVQFF